MSGNTTAGYPLADTRHPLARPTRIATLTGHLILCGRPLSNDRHAAIIMASP